MVVSSRARALDEGRIRVQEKRTFIASGYNVNNTSDRRIQLIRINHVIKYSGDMELNEERIRHLVCTQYIIPTLLTFLERDY